MAGRKRKRHGPDRVVKKWQDADRLLNAGKSLGEVLQALEVSEATYLRWRTQSGGMKSAEAKRLKALELENARLKKLLVEAELDKAMLRNSPRKTGELFPQACGGRESGRVL